MACVGACCAWYRRKCGLRPGSSIRDVSTEHRIRLLETSKLDKLDTGPSSVQYRHSIIRCAGIAECAMTAWQHMLCGYWRSRKDRVYLSSIAAYAMTVPEMA
eukprot:2320647-Rhodomonas_salina.1